MDLTRSAGDQQDDKTVEPGVLETCYTEQALEAVKLVRTRARRIPSSAQSNCSTRGRIHLRRPTCQLHFSLAARRRTIHSVLPSSRCLPSRNTRYDCEKSPMRHLLTTDQLRRRMAKLGQQTAHSGSRLWIIMVQFCVRLRFHQSCTVEPKTPTNPTVAAAYSWSSIDTVKEPHPQLPDEVMARLISLRKARRPGLRERQSRTPTFKKAERKRCPMTATCLATGAIQSVFGGSGRVVRNHLSKPIGNERCSKDPGMRVLV